MRKLTIGGVVCLLLGIGAGGLCEAQIEPTWESMAENYDVPEWFLDGKFGVWMHWGIPSATDENRPGDGSHYGRRMYGATGGQSGMQARMNENLRAFHEKRYGPVEEFGYEDLVPLFKAEKWDPDALVQFFKDNGARVIMPVACHHDNFDMYDSFHPWNSVDMGPERDTLKEWKAAAYKHGLKFGISTHLYWSPSFFEDGRQGENHKNFSQQDIRFTQKDGVLYAFVLAPPSENILIKTLATGGLLDRDIASIELMGSAEKVNWKRSSDGLTIPLPTVLPGKIVNGFRIRLK